MLSIAVQYTKTFAHYIACKELTLPKAVVLGLNLKGQGRAEVMAIKSAHCSPRGAHVDQTLCESLRVQSQSQYRLNYG